MKRILATTLAFVLALTLVTPAWAAEDLKDISQESPEVQELLKEMYDEGLLQENTNYDLTYFGDGENSLVYPEGDPVGEYIAAHPEEMAALDYDALLAGWGYRPPRDAFMEDYGPLADSFEEAVQVRYAENRVDALWLVDQAEEYKTEYPEAWAAYDEDTYFGKAFGRWVTSKEDLKAEHNYLTDEELSAYLFVDYVNENLDYDYETDTWTWNDPDDYWNYEDPEPTLTLVANGEAVDAALTAESGVTYVDAAALRAILGAEAVPETLTGALPVREYAEAAGWDVVWYDGGWEGLDQQVCLWDGEALKAQWAEEFGPAMDFLKDLLTYSEATLAQEGGYQVDETIKLDVTRFHSLDGDKKVSADIQAKEVFQDGVLDLTLEFNLLDFLGLFDARDLSTLAQKGNFDLDSLKALLKAGKIELLMDMKTYEIAMRAPILALIAPDTFSEDWMGFRLPGAPDLTGEELDALPTVSAAEMLDSLNVPQMLYDGVLNETENQGGDTSTVELAALFADFFGKDCFTHTGDSWTYSLTTDGVNEVMNALLHTAARDSGEELPDVDFFRSCDLTYTVNTKTGAVDMKVDMRPNAKGIADLAWEGDDFSQSAVVWTALKSLLSAVDFQITAQAKGDGKTATETMKLHWVNVGELTMDARMKMGTAKDAPRKPGEVTEISALYAPGGDSGFDLGIIGGQDGPTSITVTPAP